MTVVGGVYDSVVIIIGVAFVALDVHVVVELVDVVHERAVIVYVRNQVVVIVAVAGVSVSVPICIELINVEIENRSKSIVFKVSSKIIDSM